MLTDGWTDGRTDVCPDTQVPPVFYKTSSPLGPPYFKGCLMEVSKQGKGTALLAFGRLVRTNDLNSFKSDTFDGHTHCSTLEGVPETAFLAKTRKKVHKRDIKDEDGKDIRREKNTAMNHFIGLFRDRDP